MIISCTNLKILSLIWKANITLKPFSGISDYL